MVGATMVGNGGEVCILASPEALKIISDALGKQI